MFSRNISFIVGQHHCELDQAIWHHRACKGFVLEGTTMHESIGKEVMALWFDQNAVSGDPERCEYD